MTFSDAGGTLGSGTITNGKAVFSIVFLEVEKDVVSASYAGDADHSAASATVTQTVN